MATYGIKELSDRYNVGEHTVLHWIRLGELAAINVARKQGGRPKWRITQSAVDAFEALRSASPEQSKKSRRGRVPQCAIDFYK